MTRKLGAPSPALVISLIALFVALGGTSLAAATYVNGKQIKPHSIPKNRLTASAIKGLKGERGPAGVQGQKGDKGDQGEPGPSNAYSTYVSSSVAIGNDYTTVASLTLASGSYVVIAKTQFYIPSGEGTGCRLEDSSAGVLDVNDTSTSFTTLPLAAPLTTSGSTVSVVCASNENDAQASNTHLIAIKLGAVNGS